MSTETTLEEFDESPEAGLVLESLGFYYVLLTADTSNKVRWGACHEWNNLTKQMTDDWRLRVFGEVHG
jgi:hypothetical protein